MSACEASKLFVLTRGKTKFSALATDYRQKAEKIYEFCYSTLRNTENGCLRDKIFLKEGSRYYAE